MCGHVCLEVEGRAYLWCGVVWVVGIFMGSVGEAEEPGNCQREERGGGG